MRGCELTRKVGSFLFFGGKMVMERLLAVAAILVLVPVLVVMGLVVGLFKKYQLWRLAVMRGQGKTEKGG